MSTERFSFYLRSIGGELSFAVPAGSRVTIVGPVYSEAVPYVPIRLDLSTIGVGVTRASLKLVKGALYTVRLPTLDQQTARSPFLRLRVEPRFGLDSPIITTYENPDQGRRPPRQ